MFQAIIEDRDAPEVEKSIDRYSGFLFYDDNGMPLVSIHWQHRFNHMVESVLPMYCHKWHSIGSTDSIIWLADTMISTEYRCQTLHHIYASTRIVRIWQNRE